jgi:membrane protein
LRLRRLRLRSLRVRILNRRANAYILLHPLAFTLSVIKGFRANQGLLLAGAVAYYALLSIVPFLMLVVVALSHFIDQAELLVTMRRYLELLVPGQSASIVGEVANFLDNRDLITWVLGVTMLFFSSFAFTVLENAMSVIFIHRVAVRRRHFLVSAVLPYCYMLALGVGVLLVTVVAGTLQVMGRESVELFGATWSLNGVSGALLYLLGLLGEILVLTSIYLVMPVGRLSTFACAGGRGDGGAVVGNRAPRAGLVFLDPVPGERRVRLDDDGHRRHVQPRDRRHAAPVRRPGDCRIRARRPRQARAGHTPLTTA